MAGHDESGKWACPKWGVPRFRWYIYNIHTLYIYNYNYIYIYIYDISDFILNFTVEIAMVGHRALILDTVCGEKS